MLDEFLARLFLHFFVGVWYLFFFCLLLQFLIRAHLALFNRNIFVNIARFTVLSYLPKTHV